jgi:hypothetical protein
VGGRAIGGQNDDGHLGGSGNRVETLIRGHLYGYFDLVEMRGVPGRYPDRPLERSLQ